MLIVVGRLISERPRGVINRTTSQNAGISVSIHPPAEGSIVDVIFYVLWHLSRVSKRGTKSSETRVKLRTGLRARFQ
jgi:hypothetical protein